MSDARNCLAMIRMVIEEVCPPGVLPSEEDVNAIYNPLPVGEAEAIARAIIETVRRLESRIPD
ncbi:MAG: hypothetical protein E5W81_16140 [Mesorhizobium sp.]|nr:MAG: hypothetical protein E5W81_16140 [Mesorhizobium sp.]